LQCVVVGDEVEVVELSDRRRHAARALVVDEVVATLEVVVDDIEGGGDSEVVVVGEGDGVDKGGEDRVDDVFIDETQHGLELGTDLHESDRSS